MYINYKSDFSILVSFEEGIPTYPWRMLFRTDAKPSVINGDINASYSAGYMARFDGTKYTRAQVVSGSETDILIEFKDHGLQPGDLRMEWDIMVQSDLFENKKQRLVAPKLTPVVLVESAGDEIDTTIIPILVPIIKGDGSSSGDSSVGDVDIAQSIGTSETTVMSQKAVTDELDAIKSVLFPLTLSYSGGGVYEVGATPTVTLTWSLSQSGETVSAESTINGVAATSPYVVYPTSTTSYALSATYSGSTVTGSQTATFVYASYYGVVLESEDIDVTALTKSVKSSKALSLTSLNLDNEQLAYAYPTSFGELSSIKDGNNFEYINSYTRTTISVDGVSYYLYRLTSAITISGFTQIFS
ncbi:MAG: hypothetical protein SNH55_03835 [Rikenellaceae bacterium]